MSKFDPSQYSNLREYVEAVQGAPIDYSNPQQQDILNAAVTAMYGGGDTGRLQSFFPQSQTTSTSNTAGASSQGVGSELTAANIANTSGMGAQGIGVSSTPVGALTQATAPAITFTPGLADQTMEQKAAEYNRLREDFTDAQIRAAADATFGTQSATDWSALTNLAGQGALTQATSLPSNVIGGVILAGDSWLSDAANTTTIGSQIGQDVTNVAVGGSTTSDTLNQLNSFIGSGGTFAPGSTVMLDIGGNDLLQGASADTVRDNLQQIVSTLGNLGVNVVLSGAPSVGSVADVTGSTNLAMSNIFNDVAANNQNVTLVDAMSGLLNQKNLVDDTGFHMNEAGQTAFNAALSNAYLQSQGRGPIDYSDQAIRDFVAANNLTADQAVALAPSFGLTGDRVRSALAQGETQADVNSNVITDYRGREYDTNTVLNLANQLAGIADTSQFSGGVFGVQKGSVGFDYDQAVKALGRDVSTAEQVLLDSARSLIDQGITDLSKLTTGDLKATVTVSQAVDENGLPTGEFYAAIPTGAYDDNGPVTTYRMLTPEEAARIRTEEITGTGDDAGSYTRRLLDDVATGERGILYDGRTLTGGNILGAGETYTGKGSTGYQIVYDEQGKPRFVTEGRQSSALSTLAPLLQFASFIPGAQPFVLAANAAIAASQGNVIGALASLAGAGGYTNLATGLNVANAARSGDVGTLVGSLLSNPSVANMANTTMLTDTISLADLGNAANVVANIENKNLVGALNAASSLTNSADVKVAASAATILTELSKDNPNIGAIINATQVINNTTSTASKNVDANIVGSITNRVVDDLTTQGGGDLGSSTYISAVRAGATEEEALEAANAVTGATSGVVINAIPDAGPSNVVTTTYGQGGVDTNFGDLEGAIAARAIDNATRVERLDRISNQPKFADAFAQARSLLGPNQTFTWQGKEYSTATFAERPDLGGNVVPGAASTTAGAGRGSYAGYNLAEDITSKVKSTPPVTEYGGPTILGLPIGTPQDALNTVNRMGDVVLDFSRGIGAGFGNFMNQVGTLAHIASASISGGDTQNTLISKDNLLSTLGKDLAGYYNNMTTDQSQKEWKTFVNDVSKAPEYLKPFVALQSGIQNFGGVVSALGGEVGEEVAPLLSGFGIGSKLLQLGASGTAKSVAVASTLGDMAESAQGSYDNVMKGLKDNKNMTDEEKHWKATQAAAGSMAATAIFGYGANSYLAKSIVGDMIATPAQKVMGPAAIEYITEYPETFIQSLNDKYAIKGSIDAKDISEANTDSSIAALLGTKTAGTITGTVQVVGKISNEFVGAGSGEKSGVAIIQSPSGQIGFVPSGDLNVGQELDADNLPQIEGAADLVNEFNFDPDQAARIAGSVEQLELTKVDRQEAAEQEASDFNPADIDINAALQSDADSRVTSEVQTGVQGNLNSKTAVESVVSSAISNGVDAGSAINSTVGAAINSGTNTTQAVSSSVAAAINSGANASVVVDSAITSAANSGASVDVAIGSAISSAVTAGADVNTVVQAATSAAAATGNNVSISSDANTVTISNATTNTQTTVNTSTGVTTTVDNNTGATTVVDGNTTTVVDANTTSQTTVDANTNTQTTVVADAATNTNTQAVFDPNTNTTTSVTVDANNNTTTQTTINADTQTTVLTDPNTNTQTTVVINANTGEVIDVKEGEIPPEWTQPVIEAPSVPGVPGAPATTPTVTALDEDAATRAARLRLPQSGDAIGGGRAGLPSTIDISGEGLRSRVTQGQIDPLARVKEAQAELEREVMMNQIDPRLLSVMQQRMGIDQPNPQQQFDSDIGALAKMLRGDSAGPANEKQYYSYGSEDSIDDILGGKAANYAAGGYVEPLKASGGSMALPLLAKSGGALDKYHGRENFKEGKHVAGKGDGQSDDIPAWLADGEFVFPADVVSALGNGSTKAGTDKLYEMMHNIRSRARSKGPKDLPPPAFKSPLDYLKSSKRSTK